MTYLTLALIKAQSRIDNDLEDAQLELYGDAAEETVCELCGTTPAEAADHFGGSIPKRILQATLMLVDESYQYRSSVNPTPVAHMPAFERLIKPFVKLADDKE